MQDLPTVSELLTAVREYLTDVAMPELSGRTRFHARVAANVLGIVQRELELGAATDESERERLNALLDRDGSLEALNQDLCERIRRGELGTDDAALTDHLWRTTLGKLAIDQPSYAAYQRALESVEPGDPT